MPWNSQKILIMWPFYQQNAAKNGFSFSWLGKARTSFHSLSYHSEALLQNIRHYFSRNSWSLSFNFMSKFIEVQLYRPDLCSWDRWFGKFEVNLRWSWKLRHCTHCFCIGFRSSNQHCLNDHCSWLDNMFECFFFTSKFAPWNYPFLWFRNLRFHSVFAYDSRQ